VQSSAVSWNIADCRLHDGERLSPRTLLPEDLSITHREGRTDFVRDFPDGDESICRSSWTNELELELDCENVMTGLRNGHRGVTASAIKNARESASLDVTLLLAQLRTRRQCDMHLTFAHVNEFCAQQGHEALGAEMGRDSTLQIIHELLRITPSTRFKLSREAASASFNAGF
jgi:hypothetical protein